MPPQESVIIGGVGLVSTPLVRAMAVAWSAGLAVLGLLELGMGGRPTVVGPSLIGLAVAGVALATRDPASSVAALAAGGVACIVVPGLNGWLDGPSSSARLTTTSRGTLAVLGSGLLGLSVIAWGASAAGPLGGADIFGIDSGSRLGLGLALVAIVAAVAIRCGLIPLHVWAARFMEGVSPLAIPAAFSWGSAAFVLTALDWSQVALGPAAAEDVERLLIIGLALTSVVLGGAAAMFHDDIEHVLGYSILQDAGIAILAFAWLEPEAAAAARNWLVASATVKTAFAAWAAVVRTTYGGHRLADLAGWARHSPALGLSFVAILLASIGLPGMALFDARFSLISGSIPGVGPILALADRGNAGGVPRAHRRRRDRAGQRRDRLGPARQAALEQRSGGRLVRRSLRAGGPGGARRAACESRAAARPGGLRARRDGRRDVDGRRRRLKRRWPPPVAAARRARGQSSGASTQRSISRS